MNFSSVPIIVVCCYICGEIYKIIFRRKQNAYKFIPIVMCIIGGILAVVMFYTAPEMIFDTDNVWTALGVGIVSGASSTGTNQIIKQLFSDKDGELKGENEHGDTSQG